MRSDSKQYVDIQSDTHEHVPWYWRFIALGASWLILGGYLILPGLYTKDYHLKFNQAILSVFVVALLTAGYSFTALLCFACRNQYFRAEAIFLPALISSALGLLTIAYNFAASHAYVWDTAAICGTILGIVSTFLYGCLLLWTHRRIVQCSRQTSSRSNLWSDQSYYQNYVRNMYPTATNSRSPSRQPSDRGLPLTEDDRINQQMAMLLMKSDTGPSPDATVATFRIDLPEDREERERVLSTQGLVGASSPAGLGYVGATTSRSPSNARPGSLTDTMVWSRWQDRGQPTDRPISASDGQVNHTRGRSREERRIEIEMGRR